jgi:DNA-binding protein HU-beta
MEARIEKQDLVQRVADRTAYKPDVVEALLEATLEEIYLALKHGQSVSLRTFGSFYVRPRPAQWVFRFNPSQRLRKLFGWSSTYRGEL